MNSILELLSKAGTFPRTAKEVIQKSLADLQTQLPEDYLEFLGFSNGYEGPLGEGGYLILWHAEELSALNKDYKAFDEIKGLVLIGSDGGGYSNRHRYS